MDCGRNLGTSGTPQLSWRLDHVTGRARSSLLRLCRICFILREDPGSFAKARKTLLRPFRDLAEACCGLRYVRGLQRKVVVPVSWSSGVIHTQELETCEVQILEIGILMMTISCRA